MTLLAEQFLVRESGPLPDGLLGPDVVMEDYVQGVLNAVQAEVAAYTVDQSVAESTVRHGVLARVYRAAVAYYARRPIQANLSDQGGMAWSNPAAAYADLAKMEETAYTAALTALGLVVTTAPSGPTPTRITP